METTDGLPYVWTGYCRDRLCPQCARDRSVSVAAAVRHVIDNFDALRHVVLTLKSDGEGLGSRIDRLFDSFRRLRQTDLWRKHVTSGVATLEVVFNPDGENWHVHLHVLVDGAYVPQAHLSEAWLRATRDSSIVWITAAHDRTQAARYVSKYVAKAADLRDWPPERVREAALALAGRRLVTTIGRAHGRNIDPRRGGEVPVVARHVIGLTLLHQRGREGWKTAEDAIVLGRMLGPELHRWLGPPIAPTSRDPPMPIASQYERFMALVHLVAQGHRTEPPPA